MSAHALCRIEAPSTQLAQVDLPAQPKRLIKLRVIGRAEVGPQELLALARISVDAALEPPELEPLPTRPQTRGECADGPRPCPWASCRYHLFLDVHPTSGSIKLNHPGLELDEMRETCALDVADRGETSFAEIGRMLNLTLEGVRQIEIVAGIRIRDKLNGRRRRHRVSAKKKEK
jgi:hypothetical protein